jgi:glycerol-3-phosphate acyltransferase PlsY
MKFLLSLIIGLLIGSFPTGYIILKKVKNIDITQSGSGNVGAYNSYDVTKSKTIGLLVMLIDALKGLLSVYITLLFFSTDFAFPSIALVFAVFAHCFNPWLKFKGGRGLATSAGGTLLIFPVLPIIWIVTWAIVYIFIKRDIIIANICAIILSVIVIFLSNDIVYNYSFPRAGSMAALFLFVTSLMIILFIKHIDPLLEIINYNKKEKND